MAKSTSVASPQAQPADQSDDVMRRFVEHWGTMARLWGINATMAELFALMYLSGGDWSADDLQERLRISRGNVSMNLRELMTWGVVHKVHRQGERREFFRAESDVWTIFRRIITERTRREVEPTNALLAQTVARIEQSTTHDELRERAVALSRFFQTILGLSQRLVALEPAELADLLSVLHDSDDNDSDPSD